MLGLLEFFATLTVGLTVFALVDCAWTARSELRALPRWAWILLVLLVPVAGPLAWIVVGLPVRTSRRHLPPDDDPRFTGTGGTSRPKTLSDKELLRRLNQDLTQLDWNIDDGDVPRGR